MLISFLYLTLSIFCLCLQSQTGDPLRVCPQALSYLNLQVAVLTGELHITKILTVLTKYYAFQVGCCD